MKKENDLSKYIGLAGPSYEVDVERGKIREFAKAMYAPIPDFCEGKNPIIPATFFVSAPYTWGYSLERPRGTIFSSVEHDFSIPLHAEESFIFHNGLPKAGDSFQVRSTIENISEKQGRRGGLLTFFTVLTEYYDSFDQLKVEQRSVTVTTKTSPNDSDGWATEIPKYKPSYKNLDPDKPFANIKRQSLADLLPEEGPGLIETGPLLIREIVRFQGVVGEDNALHHDTTWAKLSGYPTIFGLGTHQASALAAYLSYWIDPIYIRKFQCKFKNVYWPGDSISYEGKVREKFKSEDYSGNLIDLFCLRDKKDILVHAQAEVADY